MDDSDDYFVEDIALDDETLALLDREERRYLASQKIACTPPVSKRRKTDYGWKPGFVHPWDSDYENLPEISVQADGTYSVHDTTRNTSDAAVLSHGANSNAANESGNITTGATAMTTIRTGRDEAIHALQRSTTSDLELKDASMQRTPRSCAEETGHSHDLQALEHSMQELHAENQRIQLALKQEIDARLTKEGEVTILRNGIEKTAQEHAAQIARVKAAKDEAIDKQTQIQMEMKEEIERIKTQLIFKQQEIESSLRRAPSSARVHKIYKDPLKTPAHKLSWEPASDIAGPSSLQHAETPMPRRSLKKTGYAGILPGFQNAFMASPTVRRQTDIFGPDNPPPSSLVPESPPSSPIRHLKMNLNDYPTLTHPDPGLAYGLMEDDEAEMPVVDEDENTQGNSLWQDIQCEPVSLMIELSRIILTHSMPNSAHPTLQLILATPLELRDTDAVQFLAAASDILQIIASLPVISDITHAVRHICSPLVTMLHVVGKSDQCHSIESLINLLTVLVFSMPEFGTHLLSFISASSGSSCASAVREIIIHHLHAANKSEASDSIASEIFSFLEVMCLRGREDTIARLSPLLLDGGVWATLLHSSQPEWFLARSCRILVLFASYEVLARQLLDVYAPVSTEGVRSTNQGGLLLIDRLSTFLMEATEAHDKAMNEHILTILATLSVSHPESLATLINNDYLIPSLVCFLSHLTNPLWEEDEKLTTAPHAVHPFIRMTKQTVTLMHHLVFAADSSFNLRFRLHHNPHRALAGLHHMFIVSCGRLSYAEPPMWIDKNGRHELELLSGKDLLDAVVDGPEGESVWSLYQEDLDKEQSEPDEGEMEARLLGD
ncbi:hypothetical protein M378DRAFT_10271 [Amanita muscaria Koide BX008]|uniref:Uncharacterized protein n=1 Tax=Amanita muscaria (strain Koide BX008) TaxID=946122 RepID=A0A0C2SSI2_AMAMK|nr:hypothetical protein M378DRAFT_10271 [Amanita muscaria Koide BX008]